jgi:hypothetical protein
MIGPRRVAVDRAHRLDHAEVADKERRLRGRRPARGIDHAELAHVVKEPDGKRHAAGDHRALAGDAAALVDGELELELAGGEVGPFQVLHVQRVSRGDE